MTEAAKSKVRAKGQTMLQLGGQTLWFTNWLPVEVFVVADQGAGAVRVVILQDDE